MSDLRLGIVGLPNVGKSTLFNALTGAGAPAENYPFCTVDPNIGIALVPDDRLDFLFERSSAPTRVPATVTFVDIAGLVAGASEGEGLGNRFLANIRDVDAIVHVLRCFDDPDVAHVSGSVDPLRDRDVVNLELMLADLQNVERRLAKVEKTARSGDRDAAAEAGLLERLARGLDDGRTVREMAIEDAGELRHIREYNLLTAKKALYLANVAESDVLGQSDLVGQLREVIAGEGANAGVLPMSVRIEAELNELDEDARAAFLEELGLERPGLHSLIRAGYELLDRISFFTANEKEARAWTVRRGILAPGAAGEIHTDFERGFIRAETIGWTDFVTAGSVKAAREAGLMRSEGREYEVQDGDVILFRFNV